LHETKAKISEALKGENHPLFGKTHSKKSKAQMSEAHKGKNHSVETKAKISAKKGTSVKVLDFDTNETITYCSIPKAAEALGVRRQALSYHFKKTNSFIFKARYQIEK
jgi:group I intron endonuclease